MIKLRLLIAASLLAISYSNAQNKFFVDDRLFMHFNEVVQELKQEGLWKGTSEIFVIKFYRKEAAPRRIAAAYGRHNDKLTMIMISEKHWKELNRFQKVFVVMHELGHDYYNLAHIEDESNIMRHNVPNDLDVFDLIEYKQTFYETIRATRSN